MHHCLALVAALVSLVVPQMGRAQSEGSGLVIETHVLTWMSQSDDFGGLSGLEVSPDGRDFTVVSDFGVIYHGTLRRDGANNLTDLDNVVKHPFVPLKGHTARAKRDRDVEAITWLPNGDIALSIEGNHRILIYDRLDHPPVRRLSLGRLPLKGNAGIEALASDAVGRLYVAPERSQSLLDPFPILALSEGSWIAVGTLPRLYGGRPVAADFGPDGHLYMASRSFNGFAFATTLFRIAPAERGLPFLESPKVLYQSRFGQFDNLEGLSAWRDASGHIRLTLISDDNKSPLQETQLVEFTLKKDLP